MGGFAALNFAHLADSVAVFGPQVDLCQSHLRPGMHASKLAAASVQLKANVQQALSQGARIEFHVSMDDHLMYARRLLLPPGSLVVHPVRGRIARLLERATILVPLIVDLIGELQGRENVSWPVNSGASCTPGLLEKEIWDWSDDKEPHILVTKWGVYGELWFYKTTPKEISIMCLDPPEVGEWYCNVCKSHNFERHIFCPKCKTGLQPRSKVARQAWNLRPNYERYKCMQCAKYHGWTSISKCDSCAGEVGRICEFCKCPSPPKDGRIEPSRSGIAMVVGQNLRSEARKLSPNLLKNGMSREAKAGRGAKAKLKVTSNSTKMVPCILLGDGVHGFAMALPWTCRLEEGAGLGNLVECLLDSCVW